MSLNYNLNTLIKYIKYKKYLRGRNINIDLSDKLALISSEGLISHTTWAEIVSVD